MVFARACVLLALAAGPLGCGGVSPSSPVSDTNDASPDSSLAADDGGKGGGAETDAASGSPGDAAPVSSDGTPTRVACVATLGHGLSPAHGRLDGTLVSIVGANAGGCPSDPDHLHLQVKMGGAVYDIAVNLDGFEGEVDAPLPGIPFTEGWHPMNMDYVSDLGVHSTALALRGKAAVRARVTSQLASANHISVFGTGYPQSDGAHLIHRSTAGHDGALVLDPLAAKSHVIAFRFVNDTF